MEIDRGLDRLKENLRWILADKGKLKAFLEQKGQPAQVWLDRMQQLVEHPKTSPELRSSIFTILLRLSKTSKLHPTCLMIQNVRKMGEYPIAAGGFGDVWKGVIGESTEPVCLKVVKIYQNSDTEKLSTEYTREAIVWRQLQHPNLLPFLGIYYLEHKRQICLISPWMEKGNLVQYLKKTPREDVEHYTLVHDVAAGLSYLHFRKIVHGDLKGVNVLVTNSGRACIGDFGLARVADTHGIQVTTSSSRSVGTGRWLAPELLNGSVRITSKESDMYAYGCVCYEIFTGMQPFPELRNEMAVALHVIQGERMSRPQHITELSDHFWTIMESCWETVPSSRPSAEDVLSKMTSIKDNSMDEGSDWSDSLPSEIWNNVERQSVNQILPEEDVFWNLDRKMTPNETDPDLGLIIKLVTDGTFSRHDDFDLAFLEDDSLNELSTKLPTFHVLKTELYSSFKGRVAQYFHLTEDQFRLWVFVHRWNGTLRPDTSIPNTNEPYMTMDFIRASVSTERLRILPLYLDVISWHSVLSPFGLATQGPLNGTFKSAALEQEVMIFLKHFDPSQQTLYGVGKVWVSRSSLLATLLPKIRKRMRWNSFTDVKLFEEVKPGQIQVLAPDCSFEEAGVMNHGDVICFQRDLEESEVSELELEGLHSNAAEFYDFLIKRDGRVLIAFKPIIPSRSLKLEYPEFELLLQKKQTCDAMARKVGSCLGHDHSQLYFTTTHDKNSSELKFRKGALNETVGEIIAPYDDDDPLPTILYEKLGVSVAELKRKRLLKVIWMDTRSNEVETHSFRLSSTTRVHGLVEALSRKVRLRTRMGIIRIFEITLKGATMRKEYSFTGNEVIGELPNTTLYAEELEQQ